MERCGVPAGLLPQLHVEMKYCLVQSAVLIARLSSDCTAARLFPLAIWMALGDEIGGYPHAMCVVLDCCTVHTAKAFLAVVKEQLPWIHLVCVHSTCTPYSQLLDISYEGPFKRCPGQDGANDTRHPSRTNHFAKMLLDTT